MAEPIYVETGKRYSYAAAVEWPGWCRHASGSRDPVAELLAYGPRYREAMRPAGIELTIPDDLAGFDVVERNAGDSGTEFGVPSIIVAADDGALDEATVVRLGGILKACWDAFDRAAERALGGTLRKGPRGGGRDLDRLIEHMIESDLAYLGKLGSRAPASSGEPRHEAWLAIRGRALEVVEQRARGEGRAEPDRTRMRWPLGFYLRRAGWHATHHAWEIEDRLEVAAGG